jgi:hypothetical protein
MTPITEEALLSIGFIACRRDGIMYNGHVYDFQVSGTDFEVKRDLPRYTDANGKEFIRKDDKFRVDFNNYYGENVYEGYEYVEQIEALIKALHP